MNNDITQTEITTLCGRPQGASTLRRPLLRIGAAVTLALLAPVAVAMLPSASRAAPGGLAESTVHDAASSRRPSPRSSNKTIVRRLDLLFKHLDSARANMVQLKRLGIDIHTIKLNGHDSDPTASVTYTCVGESEVDIDECVTVGNWLAHEGCDCQSIENGTECVCENE